ncbi:MAG TPA: CheR family methyltransferase [Thermoanaerobaculia bacterium]|nr:CheR family methyltransferase [Thermoanaerobaculia bacterium]
MGIGASAGGLEAFTELLGALPVDTGLAFVLVPHLAPRYASQMAEILSRATAMQVTEVGDEQQVEPNRVYVIPPNRNLILSQGTLRLLPREKGPGQYRPIDFFFRSLAEDQGDQAIGVILSGTANDGTLGLEDIKAEGGITFAQDDTARQSGMPHSAIDSGCVDFVLPPAEIANEIARIARHPHVFHEAPARRKADPAHNQVLEAVRKVTGVDFSQYKASSVYRRITRRMVLHKMEALRDYLRFLRKNPGEAEALYQDILIHVTRFFRDPETFEALKSTVLPGLIANRSRSEPLRVWVVGCSTGEEAYSLAILFAELAFAKGGKLPVQVFATDLNGAVIQKARAGVYPKSIAQDVSPERLRRFFVEVDGCYRISKTIREMCVFARHNLLTDPPFSQLDLVSCRNVLIYLEPALQQKVVPLLHYALKPAGALLLGNSESIGSYSGLFEAADAKHKIYTRKPSTHRVSFGQPAGTEEHRSRPRRQAPGRPPQAAAGDVQAEANRILQGNYVPPGGVASAGLKVIPLRAGPAAGGGFLILFEETPASGPRRKKPRTGAAADMGPPQDETDRLAHELAATRLHLQSVIEQQEAANEELQSGNEEAQSANEELQSINEELETSKEEIQSSNEELATVNDELQNRNTELNLLNNDLFNLLSSVEMAIVIIGKDLRVRRFTPAAERAFNLIPSDVGRPIGGFKLNFSVPDLEAMLAAVIETGSPREDEVQDAQGMWYSLRIRPYRTLEGKIDGAVILLVDIDTLRRAREYAKSMETALHLRLEDLAAADRSKNEFLALLAHELRNPLAPLRNAAHVLEAAGADGAGEIDGIDEDAGDAVRQAQGIMKRQIQNMSRLIEDLLDVSRITRGEVRLRNERIELGLVLRQAAEQTQSLRAAKGQTLTLSLPPEPVYLNADSTRLDQIFGNLLNNAAKFTPDGGHCWVAAELAGEGPPEAPGEVVVRVRDDGGGIAPETLPRVFDLFMQADRSYDRAGGGLGIGLTLVRRLAELHGGSAEARSAGLGQGTELVVRLPVLAPVNRESERRPDAGAAAAAPFPPVEAHSRRVLVVDDNVDTAESLAMLLRMKGHDVQVAYDGLAALRTARAFHPDAVLLDIGLPGLDGYQVAARLRRRRRTAGSLLVALTGYGREEDRARAQEAGFDHHLTKPVDPQAIYEMLAGPLPA